MRKKIVTLKNKNFNTFEQLNNFNHISFKIFILDLILVFLSIINILISYYKKKNTVHYWIIPNDKNNYRDFRSEFFFSIIKDKNSISLVKSSCIKKSRIILNLESNSTNLFKVIIFLLSILFSFLIPSIT